eukprot:615619-Rhodomonas_salina.1
MRDTQTAQRIPQRSAFRYLPVAQKHARCVVAEGGRRTIHSEAPFVLSEFVLSAQLEYAQRESSPSVS